MATIEELRQKLIDIAAESVDRAASAAQSNSVNKMSSNMDTAKQAAEALALLGVPRGTSAATAPAGGERTGPNPLTEKW